MTSRWEAISRLTLENILREPGDHNVYSFAAPWARSGYRYLRSAACVNDRSTKLPQAKLSVLQVSMLYRCSQHGTHIRRKCFDPQRPTLANMFQDAVAALNTLQTNFSVIDAIRRSGKSMNKQAIPEMIEWCRKTGYEVCTRPPPLPAG